MSAPTIPARPARSQHATMAANNDMPRIPPRPKRNVERSISPNRDTFARSPFNDMSFSRNAHGIKAPSNLAVTAPQRPPSVELPSIGQEGNEYAHIHEHNGGSNGPEEPSHTKNVMGDLPLHAPKASLPALAAKSKIAMVTRTDSDQAAAIGIGKPASIGGEKSAESRPHSRSNSSLALSRPQSIMKDKEEAEDHGIPEIGLQIPLYPNAGDVQAPTPSPYEKPHTAGIGFFNDGSAPSGRRHHTRSKSGREIFTGPPGSYGLHGHGKVDRDQFERNWYDTHPGEREKETQGAYGPTIEDNRHDWALSSDDLNRLVHESARRGIGMGKSSHPTLASGFS